MGGSATTGAAGWHVRPLLWHCCYCGAGWRILLSVPKCAYSDSVSASLPCRREMRAAAVAQAEVVACTLSAAGGDLASLMPPGVGFDALICDEAAQVRAFTHVCDVCTVFEVEAPFLQLR